MELPHSLESNTAVAAIVVNYNGGALLLDCVQSLLSVPCIGRVIVADNGSEDGSLARVRGAVQDTDHLLILENGKNLGFSAGCNRAVPFAEADYLLFVNPDCVVNPAAIDRVLAVLADHPEAGMAGCLICNPDGSEQAGCRREIPTPWRSLSRVLHLHRLFPDDPRFAGFNLAHRPLPDAPVAVEVISGAFMLVRRSSLEQVGLLDERYFLHCEDMDWCLRFGKAGYTILFVPDARVLHEKGACSRARPLFVEWHKHRSMILFYRLHFQASYPLPLLWLVTAAVWLRFAAKALVLSSRNILSLIP